MTESQVVEFSEDIPFDKLKGHIFRHYGGYDPAGLCDGGDYVYKVQVRVENAQGDVYISVQPRERSEWWSGTVSWEEFHDILLKACKKHPNIKYHEH